MSNANKAAPVPENFLIEEYLCGGNCTTEGVPKHDRDKSIFSTVDALEVEIASKVVSNSLRSNIFISSVLYCTNIDRICLAVTYGKARRGQCEEHSFPC